MNKKLTLKLSEAKIEGDHRLQLTRIWEFSKPRCLWIMLNPSTADDRDDDPTIRRLYHFAESHGYGGFLVVNLFSYITSDPNKLIEWVKFTKFNKDHTYFHRNLKWIGDSSAAVGRVNTIFAWGAKADHPLLYFAAQKVIHIYGDKAKHFGLTNTNHPKHPLYLPNESLLVRFPSPRNSKFS